MSRYSGKCDFGDSWDIFGEEYILKSKIYIGDNIVPLRIDTYKDALPYFPHIVSIQAGDKDGCFTRLTSRSFVDIEEEEHLESILERVKKYYRKCKRNKKEFDVHEALGLVSWFDDYKELYRPIVDEVIRAGDNATVPRTVHMPLQDHHRENLYEDMVASGYSKNEAAKWCFGWERVLYNDLPKSVMEDLNDKNTV